MKIIKDVPATLKNKRRITVELTWVDLTEDEMDKVRQSVGYNQFMSAGEYAKLVQFVTQTKLKEKNNG